MKIICVGMNYAAHNKELGNPLVTESPVLFMKPDSALLKEGKPFFIPDFSKQLEYETELVIKIDRLGKHISKKFAHRYYSEITVGIDFTARDLQQTLRAKGLPWELSKGFDNSAVIGQFVNKNRYPTVSLMRFSLQINDQLVQEGDTSQMLFSVDEIIEYASQYFTLKIGDLIFTGTPAGVGAVSVGDHLQGSIEGDPLLDFWVR